MISRLRRSALATPAALTLAVGLLAGCGGGQNSSGSQEGAPAPAPSSASSNAASGDTEAFLAQYGLQGKDAVGIIDTLDQNTEQARSLREKGFIASVRMNELVLKDDSGAEHTLPMPTDRTYVSFAPYVSKTHECFNHSLTTCQGEMASKPVTLKITDSSGKAVKDEEVTTYGNGFVGVWLPRDLKGEVTFEADGKSATAPLSTAADAPTCVTTMQLS